MRNEEVITKEQSGPFAAPKYYCAKLRRCEADVVILREP